MDTETLDRLLMDRALGALPADTEALLAAYLGYDTAAASRGREFAAAAAQARRLLQPAGDTVLPPFPGSNIRNVEEAQRRVRALRYVASMAAVLVVGIGLGLVFPRGPAGERPAPQIALVSTPPVVAAHEPAPGFWSTERLYASARRAPRPEAARLIWDSTNSLPRPGEQL